MSIGRGLIIIPAYNEARNIGNVLRGIRNINYDVDILVINDASKDNTEQDPTSGFQGLNRKTFRFYSQMGNFPNDFPDADTLIHMLKKLSNYRGSRTHGESVIWSKHA